MNQDIAYHCFNKLHADGLDFTSSYDNLTPSQKGTLSRYAVLAKFGSGRTVNRIAKFYSRIGDLIKSEGWDEIAENKYHAAIDMEEHDGRIWSFDAVLPVYIGLTSDIKIGRGTIKKKDGHAIMTIFISVEQYNKWRDQIDSNDFGLGYHYNSDYLHIYSIHLNQGNIAL